MSFAQTCERQNSAGLQTDCHLNPRSEESARATAPPPHYTSSGRRIPSCLLLGGRLGISVLYFESFTQPTFPKRVPAPTPTLSSEPSERKPPQHHGAAQATPWCSISALLSVKTTPQSDSSPLKSEAELVPLLSDPGCHLGASVHLHKPGNTRGLKKGSRGPAVQGTFFLGAHVTRFTTPSRAG